MKTNSRNVKIELALPVFLGILSSLILCAFMAIRAPEGREIFLARSAGPQEQPAALPDSAEEEEIAVKENAVQFFAVTAGNSRDPIQEMYREPEGREWVVCFFMELCDSREITEVILANADAFNISPALAFALSWEESRFNPKAVNRKNRDESIDRGLFQLNSRSFPNLEVQAFFDPRINARYGMGHLRYCLDAGGSELAALAIYNAGAGKVQNTGAPKTTLNYINRILENRRKIEARFEAQLQREESSLEQETDYLLEGSSGQLANAKPVRPRPLRLMLPLTGHWPDRKNRGRP